MVPDGTHSFSLADEARYTGRHHGNFGDTSIPLRYNAIKFVRATSGYLEPWDLFEPLNRDMRPEAGKEEPDLSEESEEEIQVPAASDTDEDMGRLDEDLPRDVDMDKLNLTVPTEALPPPAVSLKTTAFVVDVVGDPSLAPKPKAPLRAASPTPSCSSSASEKIVFVPRKNRAKTPLGSSTGTPKAIRQVPANPVEGDKEATSRITTKVDFTVKRETTVVAGGPSLPKSPDGAAVEKLATTASITVETPKPERTPGKKGRRPKKQRKWRGSASRDYLENITRAEAAEEGGESSNAMNTRDIGGIDWIADSSTDEDEELEDQIAVLKLQNELWEPEYLKDLDALSTSSEGPQGVVELVLGKRTRPSGLQYLVRWQGDATDNAVWILAEKLDSSSDGKIKEYEAVLELQRLEETRASSSEGDDDSDGDSEAEGDDNGEDLKLARLLQRQEELGIADDDLDGLDGSLDDIMELDGTFSPMGRRGKGKRGRDRKRAGSDSAVPEITPDPWTGEFPSASGMADAYDGFDVMEWDRPSLSTPRSKRKGKGKMPQLNLSDSDLEAVIQSSWQKDREKKKARKLEREARRAQGLLGKKTQKTGKRNANEKGTEMSIEVLNDTIRNFLMSGHQR